MAFLVLALSCLPCADKGMPSKAEKSQYELVKRASGQDSNQEDDCSPFCQCACCPGFSINHPLSVTDFSIKYLSSSFSCYTSFNLPGITIPIWQPPQLA